MKWKNSSCIACGHQLQDLVHFLLGCPVSEPLRRGILALFVLSLIIGPDIGMWPDC